MAVTYKLIASNTLTSTSASVTFSSIPNTYTDLVLRISARSDRANTIDNIKIQFNSDTGTNYSETYLNGNGSAASSYNSANATYVVADNVDGANATASTFGSIEVYIPSYTASQNKPISFFTAQENNTTAASISANAGLWRNTATISSIVLTVLTGPNFVSGSSFFLYGIKNS